MTLISITTTFASGGLEVENGVVVEAPPIFRWTIGKTASRVKSYYEGQQQLISWKVLG